MKRTFQPNRRRRAKTHGFRERMSTKGGPEGSEAAARQGATPTHGLSGVAGASPARAGLPRAERLRSRAEFDRLFRRGARVEGPAFVLLWRREPGPRAVGFAVGRRLGGSVIAEPGAAASPGGVPAATRPPAARRHPALLHCPPADIDQSLRAVGRRRGQRAGAERRAHRAEQIDKVMEKRALIAIALSVAVLLAWQLWVGRDHRRPRRRRRRRRRPPGPRSPRRPRKARRRRRPRRRAPPSQRGVGRRGGDCAAVPRELRGGRQRDRVDDRVPRGEARSSSRAPSGPLTRRRSSGPGKGVELVALRPEAARVEVCAEPAGGTPRRSPGTTRGWAAAPPDARVSRRLLPHRRHARGGERGAAPRARSDAPDVLDDAGRGAGTDPDGSLARLRRGQGRPAAPGPDPGRPRRGSRGVRCPAAGPEGHQGSPGRAGAEGSAPRAGEPSSPASTGGSRSRTTTSSRRCWPGRAARSGAAGRATSREVGLVFRDIELGAGQRWQGTGDLYVGPKEWNHLARPGRRARGGAGAELRPLPLGRVPDVVVLRPAPVADELLRDVAPGPELRGRDHPPHGPREGRLLSAVPQEHALHEGDAGAPAPAERRCATSTSRIPSGSSGSRWSCSGSTA